jgi:hypothetical protein
VGRRPVLDKRGEQELAALLELGLRQPRIAAVMNVSVRTVQRHAQRKREMEKVLALDVDAALAAVPSIDQVLADNGQPRQRARRSRSRSRAWRRAAVELEAISPERWGSSP